MVADDQGRRGQAGRLIAALHQPLELTRRSKWPLYAVTEQEIAASRAELGDADCRRMGQPATSSSRPASSLGCVMYGRCELAILRSCHPAAPLAAAA